MRFFITMLAIIVVCALVQLILPWWSIAIVAFIAGVLCALRPGQAFLAGFFGCGLNWWIASACIHILSDGILSARIAPILKVGNPILLIILTGLIAALVGGLAALSGRQLRYAFSNPKTGKHDPYENNGGRR
jgi:hypothetical protein